MSQMMKTGRRQLQLQLEPTRVLPHPIEHARSEVIEVLADLLLEAMGLGENVSAEEKEASNEREDHA
jgi:hypothetical protein